MEPKMGKLSDNYLIGVMNLPYFAGPEEVEAMASELLQLREQTRWVPVGERLPEDFDDVLITGNGMVAEGYYHNQCWGGADDLCPPFDVTHWRPLPTPPEVE